MGQEIKRFILAGLVPLLFAVNCSDDRRVSTEPEPEEATPTAGSPGEEPEPSPSSNPPLIEAIDPTCWIVSSTTKIDIIGADFQSGATVFIDGFLSPEAQLITSTHLQAEIPQEVLEELPDGQIVVDVVNPDQQSDSVIFKIQVVSDSQACSDIDDGDDPGDDGEDTCVEEVAQAFREAGKWDLAHLSEILATITEECLKGDSVTIYGVVPNSGGLEGGRQIWIVGKGFEGGAQVYIGGESAQSVEVVSRNLIRAVTPSAATPGSVDVEVINPDGDSAIKAGVFTYVGSPLLGDFLSFVFYFSTGVKPWAFEMSVNTVKGEDLGGFVQTTIEGLSCSSSELLGKVDDKQTLLQLQWDFTCDDGAAYRISTFGAEIFNYQEPSHRIVILGEDTKVVRTTEDRVSQDSVLFSSTQIR